MKAVGYIRVSRVGGRVGDSFLSPAVQKEQIAALARREGFEVVEALEELDASGGDAARPLWMSTANRTIRLSNLLRGERLEGDAVAEGLELTDESVGEDVGRSRISPRWMRVTQTVERFLSALPPC